MKKLFVLPLVLLLLCGCSQTETATPILNNISFTAQIEYGENDYICDVMVADNTLNLTVTEPQEIKGLTLIVSENGIMAEFNGISYAPDISTLPQGAVVQVLYNVLKDVADNKTADCDDENCEITGRIDDYKYTFVFAPSGLPISLEIEGLDLEILFNNVTLK